MSQSASERFSLISENLAEFLDPEIIQGILDEGRNPKVYWGKAPSSRMSSAMSTRRLTRTLFSV